MSIGINQLRRDIQYFGLNNQEGIRELFDYLERLENRIKELENK